MVPQSEETGPGQGNSKGQGQGSITFLSYIKRNKAKARSTEQRGRGGAEFERLAGTDKVSLVAKGK